MLGAEGGEGGGSVLRLVRYGVSRCIVWCLLARLVTVEKNAIQTSAI